MAKRYRTAKNSTARVKAQCGHHVDVEIPPYKVSPWRRGTQENVEREEGSVLKLLRKGGLRFVCGQ